MVGSLSAYVCLLFLFLSTDSNFGLTTFVDARNSESDLYEKAEFHFRELTWTLQQIDSSHHNIYKRSTNGLHENILKQLTNICSQLEAEAKAKKTTTTTTTTTTTPEPDVWEPRDDKWVTLPVYVARVKGEREGDTVNMTLTVVHSGQAVITRLASEESFQTFESYTALLGPPGTYNESKTSEISLLLDSSTCRPDNNDSTRTDYASRHLNINFAIGLSNDNHYLTETSVELCLLYQFYNETSMKWGKVEGNMFEENFAPPEYQFLSEQVDADGILLSPGRDPVVVLAVKESRNTAMVARVSLWDWASGANETEVWYAHDDGDAYETNLVTIDTEFHDSNKSVETRILTVRIVLRIGSKNMSGHLFLKWNMCIDTYGAGDLVRSLQTDMMVRVRLPYKLLVLPRNHVEIYTMDVRCDPDNFRSYNTCLIDCIAVGTNLESISIIKKDSYVVPVKSASYVLNGLKAQTILDMGPPSQTNQGTYQCAVVTQDRNVKTKTFKMATRDFTKLHFVRVVDLFNGTIRVTCSASGQQPLRLTMALTDEDYTDHPLTDEMEGVVSGSKTVGNLTTTRVFWVPKQLFYPLYQRVQCSAYGPLSSDAMSIEIPEHNA